MTRRLERAEIWTGWSYGTGARVALLTGLINPLLTWRTNGEGGLTFSLRRGDPLADPADPLYAASQLYAEVVPGRVVRLFFADLSWQEFVIVDVTDGDDDKGIAQFTCGGLSVPLSKTLPCVLLGANGRGSFSFDGVGLNASEHITAYIEPAWNAIGLTFLVPGVIIPTGRIDIPYANDKAWTAMQKLATATECEWSFRWDWEGQQVFADLLPNDGATQIDATYDREVDGTLTLVGGLPVRSATFGDTLTNVEGPALRVGVNAAIRRVRSFTEQATRVSGAGENGITIAEAMWVVVSAVANVIVLADIGGGAGPLLVDDQLNGFYLEAADRTTLTAITDSVAGTTQSVTVADDTAFAAGDRVRIRKNSSGDKVLYLEDPQQVALHGTIGGAIERTDIPETVNLVVNPDQSIWTGAASVPADGWASVGTPTLTRTSTAAHREVGNYSCKVDTTTEGDGYASPLVALSLTGDSPYVSGFVSLKLVSGAVRVVLVLSDGVDSWSFPDGTTQKALVTQVGTFVKVGVAGIDIAAQGALSARMLVVQDGATAASMYVDAAQITESAGQLPFVVGSGPTRLWQAVNTELAVAAPTRVRYEGTAADFFRMDPVGYPYSELVRGASHLIDDSSLGVVDGVRLLQVVEHLDAELTTEITLSSLPGDLRSLRGRADSTRRIAALSLARVIGGSAGGRSRFDGVIDGTTTFMSEDANFTAADVGLVLWVWNAVTGGGILKTTVASVTAENEIEMADAADLTGTDRMFIVGTATAVLTLVSQIGGVGPSGKDGADADRALLDRQIRDILTLIERLKQEGGTPGPQGPPGIPPFTPHGDPATCVNLGEPGSGWVTATPATASPYVARSDLLDLFVATGTAVVNTSFDGVAWDEQTVAAMLPGPVVWSDALAKFVTVHVSAYNGGTYVSTIKAYDSTDGLAWSLISTTDLTPPAGTPLTFELFGQSLAWDDVGGVFCLVGETKYADGSSVGQILTSPTGATWTQRADQSAGLHAVAWSPTLSLFAAVGDTQPSGVVTDIIVTSPTGATWTARTAPTQGDLQPSWASVTWSETLAKFVAVGSDPTGTSSPQPKKSMSSTNGTAWTAHTTPLDAETDGEFFVVLGADFWETAGRYIAWGTSAATGDRVFTSVDGDVWVQDTTALTTTPLSAAYSLTRNSIVTAGAGDFILAIPATGPCNIYTKAITIGGTTYTDLNVIDVENDGTPLGTFKTINLIGGGGVDAGGRTVEYTPPGGTGGVVLKAVVDFDNDAILAFSGYPTPELVAAPGAGFMHTIHHVVWDIDTSAGAYSGLYADYGLMMVMQVANYTHHDCLRNTDGGGDPPNRNDLSLFFEYAGKFCFLAFPPGDKGSNWDGQPAVGNTSMYENLPILLYVEGFDEIAGGNAANSMRVTVFYSTMAVTA